MQYGQPRRSDEKCDRPARRDGPGASPLPAPPPAPLQPPAVCARHVHDARYGGRQAASRRSRHAMVSSDCMRARTYLPWNRRSGARRQPVRKGVGRRPKPNSQSFGAALSALRRAPRAPRAQNGREAYNTLAKKARRCTLAYRRGCTPIAPKNQSGAPAPIGGAPIQPPSYRPCTDCCRGAHERATSRERRPCETSKFSPSRSVARANPLETSQPWREARVHHL